MFLKGENRAETDQKAKMHTRCPDDTIETAPAGRMVTRASRGRCRRFRPVIASELPLQSVGRQHRGGTDAPRCPGFGIFHVTHTIEISLRIPSLRVRPADGKPAATIANSDVRFIKHVELETVPKPGDVLTMTVGSGGTFQCDVVRSDWHHDKNMFVTACRYSKRSISEAEYQALMDASDWQVRALL
jgi:hypothetical protein